MSKDPADPIDPPIDPADPIDPPKPKKEQDAFEKVLTAQVDRLKKEKKSLEDSLKSRNDLISELEGEASNMKELLKKIKDDPKSEDWGFSKLAAWCSIDIDKDL